MDPNKQIDPNANEVASAIQAGVQAANIQDRVDFLESSPDGTKIPYALVPAGMSVQVLDKLVEAADKRLPTPRRTIGTAKHQELGSFVEHVNRFKVASTAIFADVAAVSLTAVFDYHNRGTPGWGQHRAVYACPLSRQWKLWLENNERTLTQDQFAEFIDANMADLAPADAPPKPATQTTALALQTSDGVQPEAVATIEPPVSPAEVLTMARKLTIHTKGEFSRHINPTTGEHTLIAREQHESGSTKIPRAFYLKLQVFEGGEFYRVEARIRMQLQNGRAVFGYSLYQVDEVLRVAFDEVRAIAKQKTELPVFAGTPE